VSLLFSEAESTQRTIARNVDCGGTVGAALVVSSMAGMAYRAVKVLFVSESRSPDVV